MSTPAVASKASLRDPLLALLLFGLCLAAILVVGYDLLVRSPLSWHVRQPATIQGGIEALVLMGFCGIAAVIGRRWSYGLGLLMALLYLRRHNAELNLLVGLVYLEILLGVGRGILGRFKANSVGAIDSGGALVVGVALWVLLSVLLSLVNLATPWVLGSLLLVLGVLVFATQGRQLASVQVWCHVRARPWGERLVAALVFVWFVVLAARAPNILPYDALWYISQGDRLLAPNGSLFESLGLVSPVHYFPKLWEILLLPLTSLGQLRLQMSFGIATLALLVGLVWQFAGRMGLPPLWRWWLVWVLATLPAIANSALGLKADLLCGCFLAIMCSQLWHWSETGSGRAFLYAAAAAALACSIKLIAIPYVGIAVLLTLGLAAYYRIRPRSLDVSLSVPDRADNSGWLALLLAVLVALVLVVRTWMLAGVPTIGPGPLMSVWNSLGWELREPVGTLNWTRPQDWAEVPRLLYEWLFAPSFMSKIRIGWTGNFWLVLLVFAALLAVVRVPATGKTPGYSQLLFPVLLALTGLGLAVAWKYHSRGSDGNYFLFAVCMAGCLGVNAVARRLALLPKTALALSLALLLTGLFHANQSFVTTSWSPPGTRVWDWNFTSVPLPEQNWREQRIERLRLKEINAYLKAFPRDTRLVAHGFDAVVATLPVRVEFWESIMFARPEYGRNAQDLLTMMDRFGVDHLLLAPAKENAPPNQRLEQLRQAIEATDWQVRVDQGGTLYSRPTVDPSPQ